MNLSAIKEKAAKKKIAPGDYGYIDLKRKRQLIKVVLWVILIAAIIGGGWLYTGTRFNIATVLGIILVLPAAKSVIGLILIARYRTGSSKEYEKIAALTKGRCHVLSDLVLTRYEGAMCISIAVIHGGNIFAYVPKQKMAPDKIKEYLSVSVRAGGSEASPSVYTDFTKFCDFIKKMTGSKNGTGKKDDKIRADLLSRAV